MSKKPHTVSHFFGTGAILRELLNKSRKQQVLLQKIRSLLPAPLDEHCKGAVVKGRQLLLYVDASIWASRLRFISRDLADDLQNEGFPFNKISIRVMLERSARRPKRHHAREISAKNALLIEQLADGITDPELQASLKRLSRHHR